MNSYLVKNIRELYFLEDFSIGFPIKRVFYIINPTGTRGGHANRFNKEVVICLTGAVTFKLNDGKQEKIFRLSTPNEALFINKMTWVDMSNFADNTIILVMASEYYNKLDYIRSLDEFLINIQ